MEKTLTKDRILELYLNVVELGDMIYGVKTGARHHFGKQPSELSLRESTFLAAMLPGPKVYDPHRNRDLVMNRSDHLLGVMLKGHMITEDQYLAALVEIPFAGKPASNVQPESKPVGKDRTGLMEDDTTDVSLKSSADGIVEIPIKK
jgi:monofunctional biosynthetic peptidoglycan transglycosylase